MNPYRPPQTETARQPEPASKPKANPTHLSSLVLPALGGAIAGSFFFAPMSRGPGDPSGRGIGAGLGGLAALLCAIVIRNFWRRRHRSQIPPQE